MSSPNTPNSRAGGTIRPWRFVNPTTADNTVAEADAGEFAIGVTRGDNLEFDTANHATTGDPVRFQDGVILTVQCGGSVTANDIVESDADGQAVTRSTGLPLGVALQSGASGELIEIYFNPVWALA